MLNLKSIKTRAPLGTSFKFFLLIIDLKNQYNEIDGVRQNDYAEYLSVTRQTIGLTLQKLAESGIIKYKYSGRIRLNPNFYFEGGAEDLEIAKKLYEEMRSDN